MQPWGAHNQLVTGGQHVDNGAHCPIQECLLMEIILTGGFYPEQYTNSYPPDRPILSWSSLTTPHFAHGIPMKKIAS